MKGAAPWLLRLFLRLPGARVALRELLKADGATALGDALLDGGGVRLKALLASPRRDEVRALFYADDFAQFRALALADSGAPLRRVLFEEDYRALREMLSQRGHEALMAIVHGGADDIFRMLAIARHGEPLARLLFENDARLLRDLCRTQPREALVPLIQAERARILASLDAGDALDVIEARLADFDPADAIIPRRGLRDAIAGSTRWQAVMALRENWRALGHLLPDVGPESEARREEAFRGIRSPDHVRGQVLDAITDGDLVHLAGGSLRFPCRHSLWTLMHEILIHEDYYFPCDTDAPRIIDGGAHMGMAIYYFKRRYPRARITAFEPVPKLREMAEENAARNGFEDVEILPFALAAQAGEATFYVSEAWSMAGSLHDRRGQLGDAVDAITVDCVPLSAYLGEPVHFLKLDIEGAEVEVLAEAAAALPNVHYLFCEYHQGGGLTSDRLARLLALLEAAGFDVQVAKSHNFQQRSRTRPFTHFDGAASMLIWARNRRWPGGGDWIAPRLLNRPRRRSKPQERPSATNDLPESHC